MLGNRRGQAILLVVVAMSLVLLGGIGLAIDGSQYYTQRTMAQAAADAAAEAGILSIFDGTNLTATHPFTTTDFICTVTDQRTPCVYAQRNGFGATTDDVVNVDFNPTVTVSGVSLSSDTTNLIRVTITRTLHTSFMRLFGTNTATIKAAATGAIVSENGTVPIIITHPSNDAVLSINGGKSGITVCGGSNKSIQINSSSTSAVDIKGSNTVDLSHAGKDDDGFCNTGTGGDFGIWGDQSTYPGTLLLGTRPGTYIPKSSPIADPFASSVSAPAKPTNISPMGTKTPIANGTNGCTDSGGCQLYHPGYWPGGFQVKNETAVFAPGVYYIDGGTISMASNSATEMSTGLADDASTGQGMLVYLTGGATVDVGANGSGTFVGSSSAGPYKGILFFQDRSTNVVTNHNLGGGGSLSLTGTMYFTYTTMTATVYPTLNLSGGSGSGTTITGEIIAGEISIGGNSRVTMNLSALPLTTVRKIALVK